MPQGGRKALWALIVVGLLLVAGQSSAAVFRLMSGRLLQQDELLVAGEDGARVWLAPGITMHVAPGSELARVNKGVKLWLSNPGRTPTRMISLVRGRVDIESNPKTKHAVLVRAPFDVAAIAEAADLTVIAGDERTTVVNHTGRAYTSVQQKRLKKLVAGVLRHVSERGVRHTRVLTAPRVELGETLFAAFSGHTRVTGVNVEAAPEADGYELRVFEAGAPNEVVAEALVRGQAQGEIPNVPPGRYLMSARAIDEFGIVGATSEPVEFKVLGLELSTGGHVDPRGRIIAGYDRQVRFRHADGLLLKQGKRAPWIPVPELITLDAGKATQFHLRRPGDSRLVSARVFPHPAHAVVDIGPKLLTWPGPSAEVSVRFVGGQEGAVPSWLEPRMRVLLGIDELSELSWSEQAGSFSVQVPPQGGGGPWVLRVEVEDQWGNLLGRDFVEITKARPTPPQPRPAPVPLERVTRSD